MGFLSTLLGLHTGAEDDLTVANEIHRDAKGRELSRRDIDAIAELMAKREDKLERARDKGGTGQRVQRLTANGHIAGMCPGGEHN